MKIKYFKALWGMENRPLEENLARIKEAGYDGVETGIHVFKDVDHWKNLNKKFDLELILQIAPFTAKEVKEQMEAVKPYNPILVNSQSGRDKMTFDQQCRFFEAALEAEQAVGIPLAHETHRHRIFFTPWTTVAVLEKFPELKVAADFSHWCCVCESLLEDMDEWVQRTSEQVVHIHGRVGYQEGPQAPDPRAPEWNKAVERHEHWWDNIRNLAEKAGKEILSFTPEYGPPNYQQTVPYTRQPLADIWEIARWTRDRMKKKWKT
jgi:hypothetical protein